MRPALVLLGLVAVAPAAMARAPADIMGGVGLRVTEFGRFQLASGTRTVRFAPGMLDALVEGVPGAQLIQATHDICARLGTSFGLRYRPEPGIDDPQWPVTVVFEHPRLTTTDGRSATSQHSDDTVPPGGTFELWTFDHPYELVPGAWTISIQHDGVAVAQVTFQVRTGCLSPVS